MCSQAQKCKADPAATLALTVPLMIARAIHREDHVSVPGKVIAAGVILSLLESAGLPEGAHKFMPRIGLFHQDTAAYLNKSESADGGQDQ